MDKNRRMIILSIIAVIIFIAIGINIRASDQGILFDVKIMDHVHNRTTPLGIAVMKKITYFGSEYFFLPLGVLILFIMIKKKNYKGILLLVLSTLGSYGLNAILKSIFVRTRPLEYFLIQQGGYSFPSGHAMVSMTFYTTMTYLLVKDKDRRGIKIALWTINFIVIGIIGFSRIYLGVHWPTDVLMGYLVGYIFYHFTTYIFFKKLSS